jgi:nicotinamidase-related amidase
VHDSFNETSPLHPRSGGNAQKTEAASLPGEPVYHKSVNSSFIGTTLETDLRNDKIDALVIVGLTTNHCISTTVRMAGNLGFQTYVVSDATATFDRIGLDDRMRPAAEVHAAALSDLQGEFATVVDTETVLRALLPTPSKPLVYAAEHRKD